MQIGEELEALKNAGLFRELRHLEGAQGVRVEVDGRVLLNFSSNDYLGLSGCEEIKREAVAAIERYGVGSGASRLVCGGQEAHDCLEKELAALKGTEAALTFANGYATAVGTLGALLGTDDVVILDKLSHACLIDGARLSGATLRVFPHNHLERLRSHLHWAQKKIEAQGKGRILVATESVFSMDGDHAPLKEIADLTKTAGALLLVDDAHGFGVFGKRGEGLAAALGVAGQIDLQMGTLSKAAGVAGGYVCANRETISLLINRARSFIYSTAPPPAQAAAAAAAVRLIGSAEGAKRREQLQINIDALYRGLALTPSTLAVPDSGADPPPNIGIAPIIPIIIGSSEAALAAAADLLEKGFLVPAIRYPTVPRGSARLRVTLSSAHELGDIEALVTHLRPLVEASR